jgi:hypothetical protein
VNLKIIAAIFGIYGGSMIGLAQVDAIPGGLWEIAKNFPILAIFMATVYWFNNKLERMLEAQRVALAEVYSSNQIFLSSLLGQIDTKQNKMADRIELLTQQVAMLRATLSETVSMADLVMKLIEDKK